LTAGVAIGHGGPGGGGGWSGHGGPGGHGEQAWMQGAQSIMRNPNLTRAEQQAQLTAWASSQNSTIQADYQAWLNQKAAWKANFTAQHQAAVAALPAAAKAADAQIQAIWANTGLTWAQTGEAIRAVFAGLDNTTKQELQSISPFHGGGGFHGGDSQEQMGGGHRHKRGGEKFGGVWNGQWNHTGSNGQWNHTGWNGQWNHTRPTGSPGSMNFVFPSKHPHAPKQ